MHYSKACGEVEVCLHVFLTSALDEGDWSSLSRGSFTRGTNPFDTHWPLGWLGPRTGLEALQGSLTTCNSCPVYCTK